MNDDGQARPEVRATSHRHLDGASVASRSVSVAARPALMRSMNERLLLEHLRLVGSASRADLTGHSGLSKPTVAVALANLGRDGLVRAAGSRSSARGPAAAVYELCPEAGFVLGLDVGRRYLRAALGDLAGAVRASSSLPTRARSATGRIDELLALAREVAGSAGVSLAGSGSRSRAPAVTQVVVGSAGVYDERRGVIVRAGNLPGWERPTTFAALREAFGPSTVVENDVDLAAIAERDHGHGQDVATFCLVSIGTGIGLGLVVDGRLHRGAHGAAGEIAYMPLDDARAPSRDARRHGALESLVSAATIVHQAREAGLPGVASARRVFSLAATGEPRAREVVARAAHHVARAVAAVVTVVDPPLVVIGGGIGRSPGFAEAVAGELDGMAPVVPEVRVSRLGDEAVVTGCLAAGTELAWRRLLEQR